MMRRENTATTCEEDDMEQPAEDLTKEAVDPSAGVDRIAPLPTPGDPDPGPALAAVDLAIALAEARVDQLRAARRQLAALLSVRLQPTLPGIFSGQGDEAEVASLSPAEQFGRRLARMARDDSDPDDDAPPDDEEPIAAGVTEDDGATVEPEAPAAESQADPPEGEGSAPAPDTSTEPASDPPPAPDPPPGMGGAAAVADHVAKNPPTSPRTARRARKLKARTARDEGAREARKAESMDRDARVLAHVVEHPGATGVEVAEALDLTQPAVSAIAARLLRQRKISRKKDGRAKRLYPRGDERAAPDEIAPSDDDGCKTRLERDVLEACREHPMTRGGLAVKLKVRQDMIAEVCAGMCRREPPVLVRIHKIGEAQARFRPAREKGSVDG
jgi:hypothetical protein